MKRNRTQKRRRIRMSRNRGGSKKWTTAIEAATTGRPSKTTPTAFKAPPAPIWARPATRPTSTPRCPGSIATLPISKPASPPTQGQMPTLTRRRCAGVPAVPLATVAQPILRAPQQTRACPLPERPRSRSHRAPVPVSAASPLAACKSCRARPALPVRRAPWPRGSRTKSTSAH